MESVSFKLFFRVIKTVSYKVIFELLKNHSINKRIRNSVIFFHHKNFELSYKFKLNISYELICDMEKQKGTSQFFVKIYEFTVNSQPNSWKFTVDFTVNSFKFNVKIFKNHFHILSQISFSLEIHAISQFSTLSKTAML